MKLWALKKEKQLEGRIKVRDKRLYVEKQAQEAETRRIRLAQEKLQKKYPTSDSPFLRIENIESQNEIKEEPEEDIEGEPQQEQKPEMKKTEISSPIKKWDSATIGKGTKMSSTR